jgi:hypothetical protein
MQDKARCVQLLIHMAKYKVGLSINGVAVVKALPPIACTNLCSIFHAFEPMGGFPWHHCGRMAWIEGYSEWNYKRVGSFIGLVDSRFLH